jgi:RNA ligase (TIGR02306 family)
MENNNSVCYVARINEIKEIPGADNIEQGVIGGWNCIIKKGEYKVDDLVVVATTDAIIPQELSDAMNVTNYLRKGQRVRTVKLRGVYSECLIIPFGMLVGRSKFVKTWKEGDDLMEALSIFKYEPPVRTVSLGGGRKIRYQDNPNFHIYYKFPNLKNVAGMFTEKDLVEITRKIHGTNARYGIVKKSKLSLWDKVQKLFGNKWVVYEYVYGSHNVEKGSDSQGFYDTDVWATVAEKLDIKNKLWALAKEYGTEDIGEGIILYGEIFGAGIQKNYDYGLTDMNFNGFDVKVNGEYQATYNAWKIIDSWLGLTYVPILHYGDWSQEVQDKYVFNNFIEGTKVPHEGIVIKHYTGERNKVAKVINPDYLIYGEKHDVGDSH